MPGEASYFAKIFDLDSKIVLIAISAFTLIIFKNSKVIILKNYVCLWALFYFLLITPSIISGYFPVVFTMKWISIFLVFHIGFNDYYLKSHFLKMVLFYFVFSVLFKNIMRLDYPSPLHLFNTNEAVLALIVLSSIYGSNFLGFVGIAFSGSRSGMLSLLASLAYFNKKLISFYGVFVSLLLLLLILIALSNTDFLSANILSRFVLVLDDIGCLINSCVSPTTRVVLLKGGLENIGSLFGLSLEYMDHYKETWNGVYIYDPHFSLITWLWGAGVYGLTCFLLFNYFVYKKYGLMKEYKVVLVASISISMFNDLSLSLLPWYYLGYFAKNRN